MHERDVDTRDERENATAPSIPRAWRFSMLVAAALVVLGLVLSATINPLLGRQVHWDWAAGLSLLSFVLLVVAVRQRWV